MLQADGYEGNPCTCFMFMKPTKKVKELLTGWLQAAEEADAKINQVSNALTSERGHTKTNMLVTLSIPLLTHQQAGTRRRRALGASSLTTSLRLNLFFSHRFAG